MSFLYSPNVPSFKKIVLIIEDEPDTAEMLAEMMRLSGYDVQYSYTGKPVLGLLSRSKPDIILLDVLLPDISGLDLLRDIRRDPRLKGIPIVLVTGNSQQIDYQNGLMAGASAYLTKPVSFWDLKETVDNLIQQKNINPV